MSRSTEISVPGGNDKISLRGAVSETGAGLGVSSWAMAPELLNAITLIETKDISTIRRRRTRCLVIRFSVGLPTTDVRDSTCGWHVVRVLFCSKGE